MQRQLSPAGQQAVEDIARRHGLSREAVLALLDAVIQGGGGMAQFNHPELGGSGQWMRGGMTMVSDLFNHALKARVDALCSELSDLVARQPELAHSGSFQTQSQGAVGGHEQTQTAWGGGAQPPAGATLVGSASLFVPQAAGTGGDWWGPTLRWPDSTGVQNGVRYAYFSQARRLAIEAHGHVTIYDTLDHRIGGFSQQQSGGSSLSFTSQYGLVDVASLPVVSVDGHAPQASFAPAAPAPALGAIAPALEAAALQPAPAPAAQGLPQGLDILAAIEKLAELHARGVLTAEEFAAKKAELLSRL